MNNKKLITLTILWLVIFSNSYAKDWVFKNSLGTTYVVTYSEEGHYYLDHYYAPNGKLQERVHHLFFPSEKLLNTYLHKHYNQFVDKAIWDFLALDEILSATDKPVTNSTIEKSASNKQIWKIKNTWSEQWEKEYARWIEESVSKEYLKDHGVSSDCADVAYALRWIFFRINYLPAANTLAGSGMLFTHESFKDEWKNLQTTNDWHHDELFLAALNYLLDNTYTHTLLADSYPVKITTDVLISGIIYLTLHGEFGHTQIISKTNYQDSEQIPILLLSGTVPRAIRDMHEEMFSPTTHVSSDNGGLIQIRWPINISGAWKLVNKTQMPAYSEEQYASDYMGSEISFAFATFKRLNLNYQPKLILNKQIDDVLEMIKRRIEIVEEGYRICQIEDCSPTTLNYENWSTPSRDNRISEAICAIDRFVVSSQDNHDLNLLWQSSLKERFVEINDQQYSLEKIKYLWEYNLYSFDPRDSINIRWGANLDVIAQMLFQKTKDALEQRTRVINQQIASLQCVGSNVCELGDVNWRKYNTYEMDGLLFKIDEIVAEFQRIFSNKEYRKLVSAMEKFVLNVNNEDFLFFDLMSFLPFLNSDPRVSQEERWGSKRFDYNYLKLASNLSSLQISSNGIALIDNQKLIDLENKKEVFLPEKIISLSQHPQTGFTVGVHENGQGKTIILYRPNTANVESIKLENDYEGVNVKTLWHSSSIFSVLAGFDLYIFKISLEDLDEAVLIFKYNNIQALTNTDGFTGDDKYKVRLIFQLSGEDKRRFILSGENEDSTVKELNFKLDDLSQYSVVGETRQYLILNHLAKGMDTETCTLFLDKADGEVYSPLEKTSCVSNVIDDLNALITIRHGGNLPKIDFLAMNQNLEIINKQYLGYSFSRTQDKNYVFFQSMDENWNRHVYKYTNSQLEEILFPGKTIINSNKYLVSIQEEGISFSFGVENMITHERLEIPNNNNFRFYFLPTPFYTSLEGIFFYSVSLDYIQFIDLITDGDSQRLYGSIGKLLNDNLGEQKELIPVFTFSQMDENFVFSSNMNNDPTPINKGFLFKMSSKGNLFWFSEK